MISPLYQVNKMLATVVIDSINILANKKQCIFLTNLLTPIFMLANIYSLAN